jgi:hypothetical protein
MEVFANKNFTAKEMKEIKRCRMYLQVNRAMGNQRTTRRHEEQCVGMANTTATYNVGMEGMEEGDHRSIHRR